MMVMKKIFFMGFFFLQILSIHADERPFQSGEELKYDIRYKYGLVMLKAGTANYNIKDSKYQEEFSYQTILDFKTTSFFDKIYKIRDTLYSEINEEMSPLYHIRKINEGNTHYWEEIFTRKCSSSYSEVRVKRANKDRVKFDTIISSTNFGFDILSVFVFARSLDFTQLKYGQSFNISTFIGKDKINMIVHFEGQSVIERSERLKYKAYKLSVDITDEFFHESKNAMEIWISDDKNRIPLKLKAKLKIGAAEADLTYCKNLKHPFTSEVIIPPRR
jgi:hypothetical protein